MQFHLRNRAPGRLGRLVAPWLVALGCGSSSQPTGPMIDGAASLTESLTAVASAWAEEGRPPVRLSFGASSQLARQILAGAPADVFVSADEPWMDALEREGQIVPGTRRALLRNRLVVVVPEGAVVVPEDLEDLQGAGITRLGLAGEHVPAGRYADEVLARGGLASAVADAVVRGDSVRTVLRWVAEGEVDAGFVYATDARAEPAVKVAFVVPEHLQPRIVYPIAVVAGGRPSGEAEAFVAFCAGPEGRARFEAAGFTVVDR